MKNKFLDNVSEIVNFIDTNGGLYITNRQVGKSEALIELLHKDKDSYLLTFCNTSMETLKDRYRNKYKDGRERYIISSDDLNVTVSKCYIDEYFFHKTLYKEFKGAVSTMLFPVKIKKLNSNITNNTKLKTLLSDIDYKKEISMKF